MYAHLTGFYDWLLLPLQGTIRPVHVASAAQEHAEQWASRNVPL